MQVHVIALGKTPKGQNLAYVKHGDLVGSVIASDDIIEPGIYELRSSLRVTDGRLMPLIRVEKK